jgi:hypothetical protein
MAVRTTSFLFLSCLCAATLIAGEVLIDSHVPSSYAQEQSQLARMVDSYNDQIRSSEAEQWHLEDFRTVLEREPNARAYIIAYGGREDTPGKARRYAHRAKRYFVYDRGIDPNRIVAVDGGRREQFIVELWIVPSNARPPSPAPSVVIQADMGDNLLYDHFGIGYDNFGNSHEDEGARLDGFAAALRAEPNSWGCIIAYAQNGDDRVGMAWDLPGEALRIANSHKNYLVRHGLSASRISAVDGGYSEGRTVWLWIMRPNARYDRGPFIYSSRLRAGRGSVLRLTPRDHSFPANECCRACQRRQR